jgi:hypothetical protein
MTYDHISTAMVAVFFVSWLLTYTVQFATMPDPLSMLSCFSFDPLSREQYTYQ